MNITKNIRLFCFVSLLGLSIDACSYNKTQKALADFVEETNQFNQTGNSTLFQAVGRGDLKEVENLLSDSNVNEKDRVSGMPILAYAVSGGNIEMVKLLLKHNPQINGSMNYVPLVIAAKNGNIKIAQLLLDKGADVDRQDFNEGTPLIAAVNQGNKEMVQFFLNHRANVNAESPLRGRALSAAVWRGDKDVVKLLLDHGVETGYVDFNLETVFQAAQRQGNKDVIKLLEKAKTQH